MGFRFKQPLVGEKRCVTTLITAAEETKIFAAITKNMSLIFTINSWDLTYL